MSEAALRPLLQHCTVFVHPCSHAGFGQPILEAMLCGAVVVAGNNSVQAELVGNAGLLADPSDPGAIAGQSTGYSTTGPWLGRFAAAQLRRPAGSPSRALPPLP